MDFTKEEIRILKEFCAVRINPMPLKRDGLGIWCYRVCNYYEITIEEFLSKRRHKHLVSARRDFCHLVKKHTISTCGQIGRFLKKDHTLVLYHWKKPPVFMNQIEKLANSFKLEVDDTQ